MAPRQRLVPEASSSSSMEDNNNSNGNSGTRSGSSSPNESLAQQRMVPPRSKQNHHPGNKSYSSNGANQKNGKGIVPHVEDAAAREAHDIFNLIALVGSSVLFCSILLCHTRETHVSQVPCLFRRNSQSICLSLLLLLFSLLFLLQLFVVQATAVDWDLGLLFQGYGAAASFDGRYFWWTWGVSTAYFLTDLVWVSLVPHCVKSPGTIVKVRRKFADRCCCCCCCCSARTRWSLPSV
jgi:hypothetical protein